MLTLKDLQIVTLWQLWSRPEAERWFIQFHLYRFNAVGSKGICVFIGTYSEFTVSVFMWWCTNKEKILRYNIVYNKYNWKHVTPLSDKIDTESVITNVRPQMWIKLLFRDCSSNAEFSSILFFVFHCFCSSVTYLSSFSYLRHTHHAAYQSLSVGLCSQEFAPCIYFFASCDVGGSPAQPHLMLTAITNHREKLMPFRDSARIIF